MVPIKPAWRILRCLLTMVETATTWSGSVEWRMPSNKPRPPTKRNGPSLSLLRLWKSMPVVRKARTAMPAPRTVMNAAEATGSQRVVSGPFTCRRAIKRRP